ncbi:hypothetical protein [Miltoncostaea marina]|uniref:hypothetical protein n=1 Tax=Miltoncostaea marina TaxID=2843215 RepID=UPI001C3E60CC|nr:hypothetical protein [Miltoncostaea marina]
MGTTPAPTPPRSIDALWAAITRAPASPERRLQRHRPALALAQSRGAEEAGEILFRAMADDGEQPIIGDEDLGVREGIDVRPDSAGVVGPGRGMSVAPRTPRNLHINHRPASLDGTGTKPVWRIERERIDDPLAYRQTSTKHGQIEPVTAVALSKYRCDLAATRDDWTLHAR